MSGNILDGFGLIKQLGEGKYGNVIQARLKSGKLVAIKSQILWSQEGELLSSGILELDALLRLQNESTSLILEGFVLGNPRLRILLEPMMTSLDGYIQGISSKERNERFPLFLQSLLHSLLSLESHSIHHYDIKPQNILVNPGPVFKLCDFGLARSYRGILAQEKTYTLWFRPPEFLIRSMKIPPFVSDIWALGVTCYFFLSGKYLFTEETSENLLQRILEKSPNGFVQQPFEQIQRLLIVNPEYRPRASQLLGCQVIPSLDLDYPRRNPVRWLKTIWEINSSLGRQFMTYLVTVELLGRILDLGIPEGFDYYQIVLSCHYIAILYIDNPPIPFEILSSYYQEIFQRKSCLFQKATNAVLNRIGFRIYNPHLPKEEPLNLKDLPKEHYLQPVSQWGAKSEVESKRKIAKHG